MNSSQTYHSSYDNRYYVNMGVLNGTYFDEELEKIPSEIYERNLRIQHERMVYKREFVSRIDTCVMKITELINILDNFPVSYNQLLLQGSLDYCKIALRKVEAHSSRTDIFKYIQEYVLFIENFCDQHNDRIEMPISKMDLQLFEDRFDTIQEMCHKEGILPFLNEMTLEEYPA